MKTQAGQHLGWVYKKNGPDGETFVDLGLYKRNGKYHNREFVNGIEPVAIIDPNVQGNILYHFEK